MDVEPSARFRSKDWIRRVTSTPSMVSLISLPTRPLAGSLSQATYSCTDETLAGICHPRAAPASAMVLLVTLRWITEPALPSEVLVSRSYSEPGPVGILAEGWAVL